MDPAFIELGSRLTEAAITNTWSKVSDRIRKIKADKDKDSQIRAYNQLVSELVDQKADALDIARQYKEQLDKVTISDNDIESLHRTLEKVVGIVMNSNLGEADSVEKQEMRKSFDSLVEMLNSDTLRTLQLLGYNYKKAIGEPLTQVTSEFILSKLDSNPKKSQSFGDEDRGSN
ncbi:hypothetical protein [Schleiferilactobacillus harbinensis]|uniref:Uncharacterized protein n=1 Tax=Schleiferilactobacillus harbinensis TaxID=304207 RepID=A0ABU7T2U1_9LACO